MKVLIAADQNRLPRETLPLQNRRGSISAACLNLPRVLLCLSASHRLGTSLSSACLLITSPPAGHCRGGWLSARVRAEDCDVGAVIRTPAAGGQTKPRLRYTHQGLCTGGTPNTQLLAPEAAAEGTERISGTAPGRTLRGTGAQATPVHLILISDKSQIPSRYLVTK